MGLQPGCFLALLLAALVQSETQDGCPSGSQGCPTGSDDTLLLSLRHRTLGSARRTGVGAAERELAKEEGIELQEAGPFTLAGKSIYFLMTDRFARGRKDSWNDTLCMEEKDWCGGTLEGVTDQLAYIKGMGFDCIWITPVVKAADYTGYGAYSLTRIDSHIGTSEDLKQLSKKLHELGMCLVVDVVTNHMGPLVRTKNEEYEPIFKREDRLPVDPFDHSKYYHQLGMKQRNETFGQYVLKPVTNAGNVPSSAIETLKEGVKTGKFICGPSNPEMTYCSCGAGSSPPECPGWNETVMLEGWFDKLADLDHKQEFVASELIAYVKRLRDDFGVDAIRLDTAIYQSKEFLSMLQSAVGIDILGEVTVNNLTYAGSFQRGPNGEKVLNGLLNFPPFYWMPEAFCSYYLMAPYGEYAKLQGTWADTPPDLSTVADVIDHQLTGGYYSNLDLLGNFADNHDEWARLSHYCKEDSVRIGNLLALLFFMRGIPIVYYGTEQGFTGHQLREEERKDGTPNGMYLVRESLWQTHFDTSAPLYSYIASLNSVRKEWAFAEGEMKILSKEKSKLVFTRTSKITGGTVWVFINNYGKHNQGKVTYCPGPEEPQGSSPWAEALSNGTVDLHNGCYTAPDALPKVLVRL